MLKACSLCFAKRNCQVWEPTLGHLLSSDVGGMVDEIWAWDAVQNGDAGILNASSLPATRM